MAFISFENRNTRASALKRNTRDSSPFPHSNRATVGAPPGTVRDRAGAVEFNYSGPARPHYYQPFAMSGQLAEIVRGLRTFISRALSSCVDVLKPHPSKTAYRLPVIAVACCSRRHGSNQTMETFRNVGQVFRGENRV